MHSYSRFLNIPLLLTITAMGIAACTVDTKPIPPENSIQSETIDSDAPMDIPAISARDACTVLRVVNELTPSELITSLHLPEEVSSALIAARPIRSLGILDSIGNVGTNVFNALLEFSVGSSYQCYTDCTIAENIEGTEKIVAALRASDFTELEALATRGCYQVYQVFSAFYDQDTSTFEDGFAEKIEPMKAAGFDLNKVEEHTTYSALQRAADGCHRAKVEMLLQAGADPNQRTARFGMTPLHLLCKGGFGYKCELTTKALIQAGADLDAQTDITHGTAMMFSVSTFHSNANAAILLKAGANPFLRDIEGMTYFTRAIRFSRLREEDIDVGINSTGPEGEPLWVYAIVDVSSQFSLDDNSRDARMMEDIVTHPDLIVDLDAPTARYYMEWVRERGIATKFADFLEAKGTGLVDLGETIGTLRGRHYGWRNDRLLRQGLDVVPAHISLDNRIPLLDESSEYIYFVTDSPDFPTTYEGRTPHVNYKYKAASQIDTHAAWCDGNYVNLNDVDEYELIDGTIHGYTVSGPYRETLFSKNLDRMCY